MPYKSSGIIVIDKPADITSAGVVSRIKKFFGAKKAGHTGTLDPFATGIMVCCINNATRLSRFFLHGNKKYEAVLHLGVETETQDFTGSITAACDEINFSDKTIQTVFKQFEGTLYQQPPVFSALKHNGVCLYKLARKGKPVQKPPRPVSISYIKILSMDLPFIRFEVSCSAGTYIRTLCADIGKALGCGGHLKALRRIECCGFKINESTTLSELERLALSPKISDKVISMSKALPDMPEHIADKALADKIKDGKKITDRDFNFNSQKDNTSDKRKIKISQGFIKIVDKNDDLLAVLNYEEKETHRYNYCCVFHK